jgi:hypothetical protein
MVIVGSRTLDPGHQDIHTLVEFLNSEYPIPDVPIKIWYEYNKSRFEHKGKAVTGLTTVEGEDYSAATITIAAKNRSPRAVALTTAHEYMHCIQFIVRDLFMDNNNKDKLEDEAITFAEDVLTRLWNEKKIFYPSSL